MYVYVCTNFRRPPPPQFFQSPPFGCLNIFGAPPQYLHPHPGPLVILNELSLGLNRFWDVGCCHGECLYHCFEQPWLSPGPGIILCSWARYYALTIPFSTQVSKWVLDKFKVNVGGITLQMNSIPTREE